MTTPTAGGLVGRTLRQYRVVGLLGEGGMGEVYKAEDCRLNRLVAIKVLPSSFVSSPERVRRFEREARAASAINHPHIAAIYEVGDVDGVHFIAMEYVEGLSLSVWLSREGLGLGEVLVVVEQIADALARAHEAGVLHRDLKPANVIVSKAGYAKLLDFGLAKVVGPPEDDPAEPGTGSRPQTSLPKFQTTAGVVMGTMAYMSPEQARGQQLDRRSDIFSFGVLLYEAVSGAPPFRGDSGIEAASSLLRDDPIPPLRERAVVPRELVRIIAKALEKEPAARYQYLDDLIVDLRAVRYALESGASGAAGETSPLAGRVWLWGGAGLLAGATIGALVLMRYGSMLHGPLAAPAQPELARAGMRMRPLTFGPGRQRSPSMSPDGRLVSYASDEHGSFDIFVQQVTIGRPLRITEDPGDEIDPVFSPDGQTIAFATSDERIRTVPALGGTARTLVESGGAAPVFSPDGQSVVYRSHGGLRRVARTGGVSTPVTDSSGFPVLTRAAFSPDGRWLVFTSSLQGDQYVMVRVPAAGGAAEVVGAARQAVGWPVWGGDGNFIFGTIAPPRDLGNEIWAVPVRGRDRPALGNPVRVLGGVLNYIKPSVSRDQKKIAFEVEDVATYLGRIPLGPSRGVQEPVRLPVEARFGHAVVSHGGQAVAIAPNDGTRRTLAVFHLDGGAVEAIHEGPGADEQPVWSPDDRQIAVSHVEEGVRRIAAVPAAGGALRLVSPREILAACPSWSPDGRQIAYVALERSGDVLHIVGEAGEGDRTLAQSRGQVQKPSWSPDGHWIVAGVRGEDDGWSLAVVPSKGGDFRRVLGNGRAPLWMAEGRIVFLRESRTGALDLWVVPVDAEGRPRAHETPLTMLPRGQQVEPGAGASSDGRFLYFPLRVVASADVWLGEVPGPGTDAAGPLQ